jgi:hypothetical protein
VLNANKGYKGSPARSHRKIQTRCHLRGNFPCLGEERATKKGTEPLADATARLLGMRGPAPREQPCRLGGRCKEQPPNLARTPWSGVSIPLQARGHRRSMTPRAQCSSADPTEPGGWSARPLRSSPAARKHSSSTKSLKKPGHPIWGSVTKGQRKHYKI